jgi:hypothetical protein
VYLSRCGQSKTAQNHVYTHGLDISVVLCSQLPPNSGNHRDIPDSSPHRYPTHNLSHNHCHGMCICQDVGSQKSKNVSFVATDSTFQWFYALNFRQTPVITEISRTQVHTGTPHIFCHTTTAIACVFVKMLVVKNRSMVSVCVCVCVLVCVCVCVPLSLSLSLSLSLLTSHTLTLTFTHTHTVIAPSVSLFVSVTHNNF